jgi:hypothetical protein
MEVGGRLRVAEGVEHPLVAEEFLQVVGELLRIDHHRIDHRRRDPTRFVPKLEAYFVAVQLGLN